MNYVPQIGMQKSFFFFLNDEDVKNNYIFNVPGIDTSQFHLPQLLLTFTEVTYKIAKAASSCMFYLWHVNRLMIRSLVCES